MPIERRKVIFFFSVKEWIQTNCCCGTKYTWQFCPTKHDNDTFNLSFVLSKNFTSLYVSGFKSNILKTFSSEQTHLKKKQMFRRDKLTATLYNLELYVCSSVHVASFAYHYAIRWLWTTTICNNCYLLFSYRVKRLKWILTFIHSVNLLTVTLKLILIMLQSIRDTHKQYRFLQIE